MKEVLRIPGVINSHHCNTLKYHMYIVQCDSKNICILTETQIQDILLS